MTSDFDLLRQFAHENSQDAFAALVQRHLDLVYSVALRQIRSPQLAEEIAQSVFTDLARNAATLKPGTILTAWLYAVTRRTAIDVVRKESRRQLREQIASEMNNMNATANEWTQIEPLLDDAIAALDETDRSAVLLRYFENKSLREVGEALGASEDAAQKRVTRAVEKLREFFSKQKITIGASGLAILISANAVQSAPVGLAAAISTAAVLTGTTVSTSTAIAATKTIAMTTLQKTIVGTALVAAVGTGVFEARQVSQLRDRNQMLQQQQAPLAEQIRELQRERNDATNQVAGLETENAQLQSSSNEMELLKLRGEVGVLRAQLAHAKSVAANRNLTALASTQASDNGLNQTMLDYLGNPVPPPPNLDVAFTREGLTSALQNAAQAVNIPLKKLEVDDSEFPPLVGIEVENESDMQKLKDEIKRLKKYKYAGSISSRTEAVMNLIPYTAYPPELRNRIQKRVQLREQMLYSKIESAK